MTNEDLKSAEARANRLRRVRNLANVSRKYLCEHSNINVHTLSGWENARFGGLSKTGAQKIIHFLTDNGVQCSLDWLLFGVGAAPALQLRADYADADLDVVTLNQEDQHIIDELMAFKTHYRHTLDLKVADAAMLPYFAEGDYVAGVVKPLKALSNLIGEACIVQTSQGQTLLRNIQTGSSAQKFSLVGSNLKVNSLIYDADIVKIAPVLWHRKHDQAY